MKNNFLHSCHIIGMIRSVGMREVRAVKHIFAECEGILNPKSKQPIDDSYLRRRDIMLSNLQWYLQREQTGHLPTTPPPPPKLAHCPHHSAPHSGYMPCLPQSPR